MGSISAMNVSIKRSFVDMNVASWNPDRPCNDLPPIPPAEELETKPTVG
jgi:hypothetical protein